MDKLSKEERWEPVNWQKEEEKSYKKQSYWKDVLGHFIEDRLGVIGAFFIILISLTAIIGPILYHNNYTDMELNLQNVPPRLKLYQIDADTYVYMHKDYYFLQVTKEGKLLGLVEQTDDNLMQRKKTFQIENKELVIDYSQKSKYKILLNGEKIEPSKTVWNKTYLLGTDTLGRDLFARVLSGARISLAIAACSTLINSLIGIFYGGIAGYKGGQADNVMMRIVDVISTVPTTLVVIMLMVVIGPGVKTIIIAMGFSNWCTMARIVRGQVLSMKEREFVLAAIASNASHFRILVKHLIPNISGSIIVCMTMMIPGAIFTESFLSFIGLGVSAPNASWGTLVNDGLTSFRAFPYQTIIPSIAICITILALNFIGNDIQNVMIRVTDR